jgi:hypothetical protein
MMWLRRSLQIGAVTSLLVVCRGARRMLATALTECAETDRLKGRRIGQRRSIAH